MTASARAPRLGNEYWQFNPEARRGAGEFRYEWVKILPAAANVVRQYKSTGVTLRQLFYRLVAAEMLPNTGQAYGSLSEWTAKARRGELSWVRSFPKLIDNGRNVERPHLWDSAADAQRWLSKLYMEPRARTQEHSIYIGVEKNGLKAQLFQWFAPLGLPVVALGGYASQTLADEVAEEILEDGRPAILIYAGDFDADGLDIPRDFAERVGRFEDVVRVALTPEQIEELAIPPQPGKWTSARARGFAEEYAELFETVYGTDLVQIELDAIEPTELRRIYTEAIDSYFDRDLWQECVSREEAENLKIDRAADEAEADAEEEDDD